MTDIELVRREIRVEETLSALTFKQQADVLAWLQLGRWLFMTLTVVIALAMLTLRFGLDQLIVSAVLGLGFALYVLGEGPLKAVRASRQPLVSVQTATLVTGGRVVPLEDVQDVTFVKPDGEDEDAYLEIRLAEEAIRQTCDLSREAGTAMVRIVRGEIDRRRAALIAEGADLSQPARPPSLLSSIKP